MLKALATDFILEGNGKTVQSSIIYEGNDLDTGSPDTPKMPTLIPEEPDSPDHGIKNVAFVHIPNSLKFSLFTADLLQSYLSDDRGFGFRLGNH